MTENEMKIVIDRTNKLVTVIHKYFTATMSEYGIEVMAQIMAQVSAIVFSSTLYTGNLMEVELEKVEEEILKATRERFKILMQTHEMVTSSEIEIPMDVLEDFMTCKPRQ